MPAPMMTTCLPAIVTGEVCQARRAREWSWGDGSRRDPEVAERGEHGSLAELALARAGHRAGASLDELDVSEPRGNGRREVADPNVLARADEGRRIGELRAFGQLGLIEEQIGPSVGISRFGLQTKRPRR